MRTWLWKFMAKWGDEWGMVQDAYWWNYTALTLCGANEKGLMRSSIKPCVWFGSPDCYRDQGAVYWSVAQDTRARKSAERFRRNCPSGLCVKQETSIGTPVSRNGSTPYNLLPVRGVSASESVGHSAQTPLEVARWWVRYITPPGGTVCDPFLGSGTTALAALAEGRLCVGSERFPKYAEIARKRVAEAMGTGLLAGV
jgi:hypothetical protein